MVENDCEDQGFGLISDGCRKCRTEFTEDGKAIYAEIKQDGKWWKCTSCKVSYGPVEGEQS